MPSGDSYNPAQGSCYEGLLDSWLIQETQLKETTSVCMDNSVDMCVKQTLADIFLLVNNTITM